MNSKKAYFNSLDGLRTIACVLVIIAHSFSVYRSVNITSEDYLSETIRTILDVGGEGVSIFFVLSGFLITYLLIKEYNNNKQINFLYFYMRRTLRIWPLFYVVVIYALFIYPLIASIIGLNHEQNGSVLMNLIFLNNFDLLHPIPLLFSKHILDYADISYKQNLIVSIGLFITTLSVTVIMSYLSYHYFESYFLKMKRKFIMN